MRRLPLITLSLVAAAVLVLPERWAGLLQYDRYAVQSGAVWRLVTCQWTHWSIDHLIWDAAVLFLLGAVAESWSRRRFAWVVGGAAVTVPLTVHFLCGFSTFRGLSGIDSALVGLVAISLLRAAVACRSAKVTGNAIAAWVSFGGKIVYEWTSGTPLFADAAAAAFTVVSAAHLAGFLTGSVISLWVDGSRLHAQTVSSIRPVPSTAASVPT